MNRKTVVETYVFDVNNSYEAVPLEWEIEKIVTQKSPIEASSPQIFTERKDGVKAETNIRTDRFEIAEAAMDRVSKEKIAKRANATKEESAGESTHDDQA